MKRIRFHLNSDKPEIRERVAGFRSAAERAGLAVVEDGAEAVVTLGGDGTILRAVRSDPATPVLGLNLGGLGYLASVAADEAAAAFAQLAAGEYAVRERTMLAANGRFAALNDIVVQREASGRMACLELAADGHPVTRYTADGLIFATPTGSTAYSLAAGGPVLMPDTHAIVVTPLNPHALAVRPLVVREDVRFAVTAAARTPGNGPMRLGVYADGEKVLELSEGERVEIARAERRARFIELAGHDAYGVLARKLGWSGSSAKDYMV